MGDSRVSVDIRGMDPQKSLLMTAMSPKGMKSSTSCPDPAQDATGRAGTGAGGSSQDVHGR